MIFARHFDNQPRRTLALTGASSGIGRAVAEKLAASGHRVIAIARDAARLAELARSQPGIEPLAFDLRQTGGCAGLAQELIARFGPLDGLINNAGIQYACRMDDPAYGGAEIVDEIAVNLTAPILLTKALLPHLLERPAAVVCQVSSGLAFVPKRGAAVYSATKAGLHLFSEGLRGQCRGTNLRIVEMIMPLVDTPMTAGRGVGKISAQAAAEAVCEGLWHGRERRFVGKARVLPLLLRIAPGLAARLMQRV